MDRQPDWQADWNEIIGMIGQDFFHQPEHWSWGTAYEVVQWGPERVDASALRRYLEPLEFDSPLHHDIACARAHGFADLVLPITALLSFTFQPIWQPGGPPAFVTNGRDDTPAPPAHGNTAHFPIVAPRYSAFFGTDFEIEIVRPAIIGDRIGRRGSKLLQVTPKETSVGRGAFLQWQHEIVDGDMLPIALIRIQTFVYEPHAALPA